MKRLEWDSDLGSLFVVNEDGSKVELKPTIEPIHMDEETTRKYIDCESTSNFPGGGARA
jgi:hypothetical protein